MDYKYIFSKSIGEMLLLKNKNNILSGNLAVYLIGLTLGLTITLLCMFIFAFFTTIFDVNESIITTMGIASLAVGSFFSSFYVGKKFKKGGLIIGVINGIVCLFVIEMLSVILKAFSFDLLLVIKIFLILIASLAGGIYAVNKVAKRRV